MEHHLRLSLKGAALRCRHAVNGQGWGTRFGIKQHFAAGIRQHGAQCHMCTGGLARSAFADHGQGLASYHLQIDIFASGHGAWLAPASGAQNEGLVDAPHLKDQVFVRDLAGRCCDLGDHRGGGKELARVAVFRMAQNLRRGAAFHDAAAVHDNHMLGHIRHDTQIMRNKDNRHPSFRLQGLDQPQHLRLRCHIQRCRRFVRD